MPHKTLKDLSSSGSQAVMLLLLLMQKKKNEHNRPAKLPLGADQKEKVTLPGQETNKHETGRKYAEQWRENDICAARVDFTSCVARQG